MSDYNVVVHLLISSVEEVVSSAFIYVMGKTQVN